jgi:DHA3 family macrolide efflux protein-like MFS transporter
MQFHSSKLMEIGEADDIVYEVGREHTVTDSRLLRTRNFRVVWWGQLISQVGDGITKLALLWFVYSITGSPIKTTVIGMLQTIPPILFGPLIGVFLDRVPKKPVLIGMDLSRAVLIGFIPCWVSTESFTVERLYMLVFLHAIATAVFGPALMASIPQLVSRSQYTAANAWLQSTTSFGVILGPALSGIGIAAMNSQDMLCVNAVTYLISATCFLGVHLMPPPRDTETGRRSSSSTLRDLAEGFRFAKHPMILLMILTGALYSFGTSAFSTLFPVFGRKMLDLGPIEVGYLWSALGVGFFLMSLGLVRLTEWDLWKRLQVIAVSSAVSGAALFILVVAADQVAAALCMIVVGGGLGAFTPVAWGVLQEVSPDRLVGRILTIYGTGAMAAAIAGMTTFGWITQQFGERAGVTGIGLILLGTAIVAVGFSRWVRITPAG